MAKRKAPLSVRIPEEMREKIYAFCYWKHKRQKSAIMHILEDFFERHPVKPIPEKDKQQFYSDMGFKID